MKVKNLIFLLLLFPLKSESVINHSIYELLLNGDGAIKILAMGQSNAVGRGLGGVFNINHNCRVWNNEGGIGGLSNIGDKFVIPDRGKDPFVNSANNMFFHAANHISRITGREVRLIIVAAGGLSIDSWKTKESNMYLRLIAITNKARMNNFNIFMWHQGEADSLSWATYKPRWGQMLKNMESDRIINKDTKIVIGEVSKDYPQQINNVFNSMSNQNLKVARLKNLNTTDFTHFTGESLVLAGKDYAVQYFSMTSEVYYDQKLPTNNNPPALNRF